MATSAAQHPLYQAAPGWLKAAADALARAGIRVIAPIQKEEGIVDLAPIASLESAVLGNGKTLVPLKQLFFPETEVLLDYAKRDDGDVAVEPEPLPSGETVVFGPRPCDAAALDVLDQVFEWDYDDVRYRARRERTAVVAFACSEAGPECFCTSVGGTPHGELGSDLLVFAANDGGALLKVITEKGHELIERMGSIVQPAPEGVQPPAPPDLAPRFSPDKVKAWLDANFEGAFWTEATLRCLGCGACSYLCPTCHCFDIVDEATWNGGKRRRNWDCCSFALFTLHASGHNPRATQAARYRQRVMHKFKYFPERFGRLACVGCGRCVRTCGVGQSLVSVLTQIEAKQGTGD